MCEGDASGARSRRERVGDSCGSRQLARERLTASSILILIRGN